MGGAQDHGAVEALYAETPDRFVAARNELAAKLRDMGDSDAAKQVAALRKPTVAAWAVDSLARVGPRELEALIHAGKELASAQREVAAGGSADRLREAADERRRLVDRLVRASADALESAGVSSARATLDKVSDTLLAMATDEQAAEQVRRGVLEKELPAPAGFGDERLDAALLASVSELPKRSSADRLEAEALKLEAEADRLEREAKEAEAKAASAARAAAAARRHSDTARRRANEAAG